MKTIEKIQNGHLDLGGCDKDLILGLVKMAYIEGHDDGSREVNSDLLALLRQSLEKMEPPMPVEKPEAAGGYTFDEMWLAYHKGWDFGYARKSSLDSDALFEEFLDSLGKKSPSQAENRELPPREPHPVHSHPKWAAFLEGLTWNSFPAPEKSAEQHFMDWLETVPAPIQESGDVSRLKKAIEDIVRAEIDHKRHGDPYEKLQGCIVAAYKVASDSTPGAGMYTQEEMDEANSIAIAAQQRALKLMDGNKILKDALEKIADINSPLEDFAMRTAREALAAYKGKEGEG